ncbi:MAG: hypothetical protein ACREP7_14440 [Lysobacter sp.]
MIVDKTTLAAVETRLERIPATKLGNARLARIAAIPIVTINSIRLTPDCRFDFIARRPCSEGRIFIATTAGTRGLGDERRNDRRKRRFVRYLSGFDQRPMHALRHVLREACFCAMRIGDGI